MNLAKPTRYALGAAACVACTWIPLALGITLDAYPLLWWGVVSAYLGISWLAPSALLGIAASERSRLREGKHPNVLGIASGIGAGVCLLVCVASLMAAGGLGEPEPGETAGPKRSPAISDQRGREALVMAAARAKHRRSGRVEFVACGAEADSWCVVSYDSPACQFWTVENLDGVDTAIALDARSEGGRGTFDDGNAGCHWDVGP